MDTWLSGVLEYDAVKGDKDVCHFLELNSVLQLLASMKQSVAQLDSLKQGAYSTAEAAAAPGESML